MNDKARNPKTFLTLAKMEGTVFEQWSIYNYYGHPEGARNVPSLSPSCFPSLISHGSLIADFRMPSHVIKSVLMKMRLRDSAH